MEEAEALNGEHRLFYPLLVLDRTRCQLLWLGPIINHPELY